MGKRPELFTSLAVMFVLVLASQAAEKSRPLFSDWLEQTTTTGASKAQLTGAPAYGYDELQEEIGCLRAIKNDGCRDIGCGEFCSGNCMNTCASKQHVQTHFTCAPEEAEYKSHDYKHKSHGFLGGNDLDIGYCEITTNQFIEDQVVVAPNCTKFATFIATCYLNKGADLCGHPFCDEMVITVEGSAYQSTHVASYSNPEPIPGCEKNIYVNVSRQAPSKKKNIPSKAGKPSVAQFDDGPDGSGIEVIGVGPEEPGVPYDNGPENRVFVGSALIFSGPMRVTSRKYNLKTNQYGWFEFVAAWQAVNDDNWQPVTVPASAAESMFFVKPYRAILKFSKAREGYDKQQEGPAGEEYKPVGYENRY